MYSISYFLSWLYFYELKQIPTWVNNVKVVFIHARINRNFGVFVVVLPEQHVSAGRQQWAQSDLQCALNRVENIRATLQHDIEDAGHHWSYGRCCWETKLVYEQLIKLKKYSQCTLTYVFQIYKGTFQNKVSKKN